MSRVQREATIMFPKFLGQTGMVQIESHTRNLDRSMKDAVGGVAYVNEND